MCELDPPIPENLTWSTFTDTRWQRQRGTFLAIGSWRTGEVDRKRFKSEASAERFLNQLAKYNNWTAGQLERCRITHLPAKNLRGKEWCIQLFYST